jgi:peptidoglycan-associated lipoprotein
MYSTRLIKFGLAALTASLLAACSSVSLDDSKANITDGNVKSANAGNNSGNAQGNVVTVKPDNADSSQQPGGPLSKRSVYFDYDSYIIKDEYQAVIQAHAKNLNSKKAQKVVIEGNADERGSREYNLALGQKRAEAVRKALSALGVSGDQLEAISYGEEKPKATGSDEAAYAENRRADIVYK